MTRTFAYFVGYKLMRFDIKKVSWLQYLSKIRSLADEPMLLGQAS